MDHWKQAAHSTMEAWQCWRNGRQQQQAERKNRLSQEALLLPRAFVGAVLHARNRMDSAPSLDSARRHNSP